MDDKKKDNSSDKMEIESEKKDNPEKKTKQKSFTQLKRVI